MSGCGGCGCTAVILRSVQFLLVNNGPADEAFFPAGASAYYNIKTLLKVISDGITLSTTAVVWCRKDRMGHG